MRFIVEGDQTSDMIEELRGFLFSEGYHNTTLTKIDDESKENKYIYEDGEGILCYDYCQSCKKMIKQEDLGKGIFGCEFCKSDKHITIHEVDK